MARSITKDQLLILISGTSSIKLLDVRTAEEYNEVHIDGSQNIPLSDLSSHEIDKTSTIITICGKGGGRSEEVAELLEKQGFDVFYLEGGTNVWFNQSK